MSAADELRALLADPKRDTDIDWNYGGADWVDSHGPAVLALLDATQALDRAYTPRPLTPSYRPKVVAVIQAARALSEPRP